MEFGKLLLIIGVIFIMIGALALYTPLFKLPGDIHIKRGNVTFFFPIVTSIILSVVLTLLANLFLRK